MHGFVAESFRLGEPHPAQGRRVTAMATAQLLNEDRQSPKRRFVRHYGATVVGQGLILGMGVLTGILAARMLGPTGRGELAAIQVWPMGLLSLLALGVNQAIVYWEGHGFSADEVAGSTLVIGTLQSVAAIGLGLLIIPFALAKYSAEVQHLGILFVLFLPALLFSGYPGNLLQGKQDLTSFYLIRVMPGLTYLVGLVALYVAHRTGLRGVVVSQVAGYCLGLSLGLFLVWKKLRPRLRWRRELFPRMIDYGWRTQVTNLANTFNQRVDQMILSLFVPPQQLGLYAVAVTLSNAVTVFPQAAGIVTFSRGSGQEHRDAHATIATSFRASLLWLLLCCALLYVAAPYLIRFVFGAGFQGSVIACRILLPGALMIGLNQVLYNGSSALGHPGLPSIAEGVSMVITAVGLYLFIPRYGYVGAAAVSTVAYTVSFVILLGIARTKLKIEIGSLFWRRKPFANCGLVS
jgi:O-antigen/teichoic acid export membrane protein